MAAAAAAASSSSGLNRSASSVTSKSRVPIAKPVRRSKSQHFSGGQLLTQMCWKSFQDSLNLLAMYDVVQKFENSHFHEKCLEQNRRNGAFFPYCTFWLDILHKFPFKCYKELPFSLKRNCGCTHINSTAALKYSQVGLVSQTHIYKFHFFTPMQLGSP